ncbi:MAG TPA: EAL domain-containing protein [Cellulomonadaceae bacterium]|nr:EAL domain-containing protein [Cellulomonadaceae bacterium]
MERTGAQLAWAADMVASMADGVIGIRDDVLLSWNPAAEAMLGYLAADMVGAPVGRLDPAFVADPAGWKALTGQVQTDQAVRAARMPWHRPDGGDRVVEMTGMPIPPDEDGHVGRAWIVRAVDDSAGSVIELEHTDALTGLGNRRALEAAFTLRSGDDAPATVLVVDVDDFTGVNNTVGHRGGDGVLMVIASRLRAAARPEDLVARIGTDEFGVYYRGADAAWATASAARIQVQMFAPIGAELVAEIGLLAPLRVSVHIGIASTAPEPGHTALGDAAVAVREARRRGPGSVVVFAPQMHSAALRQRRLTADLLTAEEQGQLRVVYQPVVRLGDGGLAGTEALLRWDHPELGAIPPVEFIALAESSGAIHALGAWVLQTALADAAAWQGVTALAGVGVAVNVSVHQLTDPGLVDLVAGALARAGLPAALLTLEVTETALAENLEGLLPTLTKLRALGIGLSIDDFGTGYSSLAYLHRIPATSLKIDRSITDDLTTDSSAVAIVDALTQLAGTLGMQVIAEGIETAAQRRVLVGLDVGFGQGWLFARAMTAGDLAGVEAGAWRPAGTAGSLAAVATLPRRPLALTAAPLTATYTMDLNRRVASWDDTAERLTGYPTERVLGKLCSRLLTHTDEDGQVLCGERCPMLSVITDGQPRTARVFYRHADGHRVPSVVHCEVVCDAAGAILGVRETFTDDTPHRGRVQHAETARDAAFTDPLTGLANHRSALIVLTSRRAHPRGRFEGAIRIDLTVVAQVTTTGASVLIEDIAISAVATTLAGTITRGGFLARTGPTQFLILTTVDNNQQLERHAQTLRRLVAVTSPTHHGHKIGLRANIAAVLLNPTDTVASVLNQAGIASAPAPRPV